MQNQSATSPDSLWTTRQVATYFDVRPATVVYWIRTRQLDAFKLGTQWVIPSEAVKRWQDIRGYK